MDVKGLAPVEISADGFTSRTNVSTGQKQVLTPDILRWLGRRLPSDGFCLLGTTMEDLYPDPTWNFAFGQASLTERVGVYSFVRYDPSFNGQPRGQEYLHLL